MENDLNNVVNNKMMSMSVQGFLFALLISLAGCASKSQKLVDKPSQPNILLIVADDLGYTDIGVFGGEIETPNLNQLAANGLTFNQFHTGPVCAVTRAMLLTGNDNHIAGMGSQDLRTGEFGYEGYLTNRVLPFPVLLQEAGYHTNITGKWHLGKKQGEGPETKGFDHSFVTIEGGANHYSNRGLFKEDPVSPYFENGIKADWPKGAYSTDFYTDKLIEFIDRRQDDDQPFFAFAAYTSPHWPLQVDSMYWQKYEGKYDDGYEELRARRFDSMRRLGFVEDNAQLPARHESIKSWDSLTPDEKKKESRKMELYAGMVDNLDVNIGRLIQHLKDIGEHENTLIIFFSDNGAAGNDFYYHKSLGPFLQANYSDAYEEMGTENSFISYGPQWAEASASPFRYFKGYTTEGGINTPFIVSGLQVDRKGFSEAFATVMDVAPTVYQLTGIEYPEQWESNQLSPLKGNSMLSVFSDSSEQLHEDGYVFAIEHRTFFQVRKGDWKLVNVTKPFNESNFELFNLAQDPGEQRNLRKEEPEKYKELLKEWERYRNDVKVQIPTPVSGTGLSE